MTLGLGERRALVQPGIAEHAVAPAGGLPRLLGRVPPDHGLGIRGHGVIPFDRLRPRPLTVTAGRPARPGPDVWPAGIAALGHTCRWCLWADLLVGEAGRNVSRPLDAREGP